MPHSSGRPISLYDRVRVRAFVAKHRSVLTSFIVIEDASGQTVLMLQVLMHDVKLKCKAENFTDHLISVRWDEPERWIRWNSRNRCEGDSSNNTTATTHLRQQGSYVLKNHGPQLNHYFNTPARGGKAFLIVIHKTYLVHEDGWSAARASHSSIKASCFIHPIPIYGF